MSNTYELKQEARRERLERASDNAADESARRLKTGDDYFYQMNGQPILVGHHSEKRHRSQIAKAQANLRKGIELDKEAKELARRAEAVGTGGISSDDPEAVAKLVDKRTDLERQRDHMKTVNALYRKGDAAGLAAMGLNLEELRRRVAAVGYSWVKTPYESYQLQNIGARIRDAAKRAERIETVANLEASTETVGLATITVDPDDNRVSVTFPSRLKRDDYKAIRSLGFLWSPTRGAFVRKISNSALWSARRFAEGVTSME